MTTLKDDIADIQLNLFIYLIDIISILLHISNNMDACKLSDNQIIYVIMTRKAFLFYKKFIANIKSGEY